MDILYIFPPYTIWDSVDEPFLFSEYVASLFCSLAWFVPHADAISHRSHGVLPMREATFAFHFSTFLWIMTSLHPFSFYFPLFSRQSKFCPLSISIVDELLRLPHIFWRSSNNFVGHVCLYDLCEYLQIIILLEWERPAVCNSRRLSFFLFSLCVKWFSYHLQWYQYFLFRFILITNWFFDTFACLRFCFAFLKLRFFLVVAAFEQWLALASV